MQKQEFGFVDRKEFDHLLDERIRPESLAAGELCVMMATVDNIAKAKENRRFRFAEAVRYVALVEGCKMHKDTGFYGMAYTPLNEYLAPTTEKPILGLFKKGLMEANPLQRHSISGMNIKKGYILPFSYHPPSPQLYLSQNLPANYNN